MSQDRVEEVRIAIFAKAPIAGFAKTRLIPRLGAEGASHLQEVLIERAVCVALSAGIGCVTLWCTPSKTHPFFQALAARYGISLREQIDATLGARMEHAFGEMLRRSPVLLLGTDCLVLQSDHIRQSAERLRGSAGAVFVPVEDGGYILVGLKQAVPAIFADMLWGTSSVMAETESRARAVGLKIEKLAPLWDIDRADDYDRAVMCGLL